MTPLDAEAARRVHEYERFTSWCVRRFLSQYKIPPYAALDGADLHAEGILALCRCAAEWDNAQPSFRAYVARAVHNRLLSVCGFRRQEAGYLMLEFVSLDDHYDEGDDLWSDVIATSEVTPEAYCLRQQLSQACEHALETLRPLQQEVIRRRLKGESTGDIARAMRCTKTRVGLIENAALAALRPTLEAYRD